MLTVYKRFEIAMRPNEKAIEAVVSKLKEFGCIAPRPKPYRFKLRGQELTRYYIKDAMEANKFNELIEFLDKEMDEHISIYY